MVRSRRPLPIPGPLPVVHPMRPVSTARTSVRELSRGRVRMTIDHQPLEGITPEMLLWWFRHIDGTTTHGGQEQTRYRAWHPLDHVHWELARPAPGGGVGEGARFRIVEALGRDPGMLIDSVDTVEKLDLTGIRLALRVAGVLVFQLEHTWSPGRGRTHYTSVFDLGARALALRPVNAYLRARVFRRPMQDAWIRHNIEEVGLLEHILPPLWRQETTVSGAATTA